MAPQAALAAVESSRLGPAQKKALRLLSEGQSYRAAAREAGLRSTADLKRHAKRFGLVEAHNAARGALVEREREYRTAELIERMRRVAGKGARELERRLDLEPDSISLRDLTVATGVALDKLAKYENWSDPDGPSGPDRPDVVAQILRAIGTGGTVQAAVRVRRECAVDVNPK